MTELARLDLNLLRVFDAVARERHVTRSAQRLNLSQPAVSNALARLRAALGDELFLRRPGGVEPTALASALAGPVAEALDRLSDVLAVQAPFATPTAPTRRRCWNAATRNSPSRSCPSRRRSMRASGCCRRAF